MAELLLNLSTYLKPLSSELLGPSLNHQPDVATCDNSSRTLTALMDFLKDLGKK